MNIQALVTNVYTAVAQAMEVVLTAPLKLTSMNLDMVGVVIAVRHHMVVVRIAHREHMSIEKQNFPRNLLFVKLS